MPARLVVVPTVESNLKQTSFLNPKLFKAIESLAKTALAYSDNHNTVRTCVGNLNFYLQQESLQKYGHITLEVIAIKKLLETTSENYQHQRPPPKLDPIEELGPLYKKELTLDQQITAYEIRKIWDALSKYLSVGARNYDIKSSKKNKVLQPLDIMSSELFSIYRDRYTPWFSKAKQVEVQNKKGDFTNEGDLVVIMITEFVFPNDLDIMRNLVSGTCMKALKNQLNNYPTHQI